MNDNSPYLFQPEDIYLLKKEIEQGEKELKKIKTFYTDNVLMDWINGAKSREHKYVLLLLLLLISPLGLLLACFVLTEC